MRLQVRGSQANRFLIRLRRKNIDSDHGVRFGERSRGPKSPSIKSESCKDILRREVAPRGKRQPKLTCQLGTKTARSQQPDRNAQPCARDGSDSLARRGSSQKTLQFIESLGKLCSSEIRILAQQTNRRLIG